jgi:hypothetical protein
MGVRVALPSSSAKPSSKNARTVNSFASNIFRPQLFTENLTPVGIEVASAVSSQLSSNKMVAEEQTANNEYHQKFGLMTPLPEK